MWTTETLDIQWDSQHDKNMLPPLHCNARSLRQKKTTLSDLRGLPDGQGLEYDLNQNWHLGIHMAVATVKRAIC